MKPIFTAYSITDQWRPNDKWLVNLGLRLDSFQFNGSNTDYGDGRNFWFAAYNQDMCVNSQTAVPIDKALSASRRDGCLPGGLHGSESHQQLGRGESLHRASQPRIG